MVRRENIAKALRAVPSVFLIGLYGVLLFYKLGLRPLMDWDESIYAEVAKEALITHHFFNLHYMAALWFEKPPLMIWLTSASFAVLGFTEFAARFWVPIFAVATVILTYLFVKKVFASEMAAFFSVLSYFIIFYYTFYAKTLFLDVPVTFFVFLALFAFWLALERPNYFYLFWAAVGLGFMTKSVIGLLPLPIALLYLLYAKQLGAIRKKSFYWGFALFLAIATPWHILEVVRFGTNFLQPYFGYHVVERFFSTLGDHAGGPGFYLIVFTQSPILLFLLLFTVPHFFMAMAKKKRGYGLCLISAAFIFFFFSVAGTKLTNYMVPIVPFIAVITGVSLADYMTALRSPLLKGLEVVSLSFLFIGLGFQYVQNFAAVNLGWQYNSYLTADMQSDYEVKNAAEYFSGHYAGVPIYSAVNQYTYPGFSYYAGRVALAADTAHTPTPSELYDATNIFSNHDVDFFQVGHYIYIAPPAVAQ